MKKKVLVTGAAGFVGFHLVKALLQQGHNVVGIDNLNNYYDPGLKYLRLKECGISENDVELNKLVVSQSDSNYSFIKLSLEDKDELLNLCSDQRFDIIVNLAAQAGVRYSIENPSVYVSSNVVGFLNILECARQNNIEHLVYASSSSVYGLNQQMPFDVSHNVDHPVSLYAATKKSNELMAHTYSHLYNIPTTGLRFFTVYGPWGRPDMAYYLFAEAIRKDQSINVFNNGNMMRDFTYIDDIINGVLGVTFSPAQRNLEWDPMEPDPSSSLAPYRIFNIGNNQPVKLMDFIQEIANGMGKEPVLNFLEMQPGDVKATWANVSALEKECNYSPKTSLSEGVKKFVTWYNDHLAELTALSLSSTR